MLGGEGPAGSRVAEAIGPDDLVDQAVSSEDLVQDQADRGRDAPVGMEEQATVLRQRPMEGVEAGHEHREVCGEPVGPGIGIGGDRDREVAIGAIADGHFGAYGSAGHERGIKIDELHRPARRAPG
ncbi:MAG: hypothetical protein AVDCRST_MAG70-857 [uncultured Thermomicrobiales bacterium]|uniref:Uncharacterized protein n=1 Tax=uncultured Thermomicrobiales bacterium TaxID=1645740 RepID=A0A6J4UI72_9BACT|nr:MAG: hypothetical protein AVDCRST_MAG70-857 [uncultured Thermomicrobiales bacterium]